MKFMFYGAKSFNQGLNLNINNFNMRFMFDGCPISPENKSNCIL